MSIQHAIWDFDGTIVDTYPNITTAYLDACRDTFSADLDYNEVYRLCKGSLTECYAELARNLDTSQDSIREAFIGKYEARTVGVGEVVFDGVLEIFKLIRERGGMNLLITHRDRASLEKFGDMAGCRDFITDIIAGDDGFPLKPDPTAFLHFIEKHALPKENTIGIGDRALDVGAAKAAGITSCYYDPEGLDLAKADVNICEYAELLRWLQNG